MNGSGFIVGPKHKLLVEAGPRSSHDPLRNKTYIIDSMVTQMQRYNPLVEMRDGKITQHGAAYFWSQLIVDGQGIKRINTPAVLFLAWAYRMTEIPTDARTPWLPQRGLPIRESIKTKKDTMGSGWWDILGSSLDVVLAMESISLVDAIRGIHRQAFRVYLTKAMTFPMSVLFTAMHSVTARMSVMLFTMPELSWKGPANLSRVYISTADANTNGSAGPISIPRRRTDGGAAKQYIGSNIRQLYYDGRCDLPSTIKRRKGDVVNYDFECSCLPLSAVPFFSSAGQMKYELYLTRAVHVLHWITEGKLSVVVSPCHPKFVHTPRLRSILDIIPRVTNNSCTFVDGHEISWAFLHYLYWENQVTKVTLIGSTCTAISEDLGTWLDLLALSYIKITPDFLTSDCLQEATLDDTRSAITESNLINQYGCIPYNYQHTIRMPFKNRIPIERLLDKGVNYGKDNGYANPGSKAAEIHKAGTRNRDVSMQDLQKGTKKSRFA